jgi:hypothetical protein
LIIPSIPIPHLAIIDSSYRLHTLSKSASKSLCKATWTPPVYVGTAALLVLLTYRGIPAPACARLRSINDGILAGGVISISKEVWSIFHALGEIK